MFPSTTSRLRWCNFDLGLPGRFMLAGRPPVTKVTSRSASSERKALWNFNGKGTTNCISIPAKMKKRSLASDGLLLGEFILGRIPFGRRKDKVLAMGKPLSSPLDDSFRGFKTESRIAN